MGRKGKDEKEVHVMEGRIGEDEKVGDEERRGRKRHLPRLGRRGGAVAGRGGEVAGWQGQAGGALSCGGKALNM